MAGPAHAEDGAPKAQRTKGPRVWLDMDQAELDDAYDQSVYAPNGKQISARNATNSELARQRLGPPRRAAYGPSEIEKLDIYIAKRANAPINLFIHGGAWRGGKARDFGYAAEMFVGAGAHFVVPDFVKVQDAGGSLFVMVEQVRRAVAWTYRNAASFGGDANRLYLSDRSSGAHLGGVVAITDWKKDFGLLAETVKGYTLSSGMYDLRAPRLSKRGNYVTFTDDMEQALSPQRHLDRIVAPVVLLYGSLETPEFKRQTREFAEALKNAGKQVKLVYAEGYNHYEIAETIANPYGFVGRAILEQMALAPA
ncbi:MAG TPA: alpha/beta hydrolase [Burkholderiales bacterium]